MMDAARSGQPGSARSKEDLAAGETDDTRKKFIVDTALDVLGATSGRVKFARNVLEVERDLLSSEALSRFCDSPDPRVLHAYTVQHPQSGLSVALSVDDEPRAGDGCATVEQEMHFVKRERAVLPDADIDRHLMVTSQVDSPLVSLYLALQNVYGPALQEEGLDAHTRKALATLQEGLRGAVVRGPGAGGDAGEPSSRRRAAAGEGGGGTAAELDVSGITELRDELTFWEGVQGGRAAEFVAPLSALCPRVAEARQEGTADALQRALEDAQDALGDLWRAGGDSYPQRRMEHLLGLVSVEVVSFAQRSVGARLWDAPFARVREAAAEARQLSQQWREGAAMLTGTDWADRWRGGRHEAAGLAALEEGLAEAVATRGVFEELGRLLPAADRARLGLAAAAAHVSGASPLQVGRHARQRWRRAVAETGRALAPAERQAAAVLRRRIAALADRPPLLLSEFSNFSELLRRPAVARELEAERETLVGRLLAHVEDIGAQFDRRACSRGGAAAAGPGEGSGEGGSGHNLSSVVDGVVWAHQTSHRVRAVASAASGVLRGVAGLDRFREAADALASRVEAHARAEYQAWEEATTGSLRDPSSTLVLETSGRLMDLDVSNDGDLRVHYSERLVTLLRETRQLSELGYRVPREVLAAVETGERFYRYGLKLKQVANFYNTMGDQIIASQKGMLLMEAHAFEKMVTDHRGATWDSPDAVERYVADLMGAAEKLTSRNRKLRALHAAMADDVAALAGTSLLRDAAEWEDRLRRLRAVFEREQRSNTAASMDIWRRHWDHQLYKAFELQYRACLESLGEQLPDMQLDLCVSRRRLAFRPPLEDVRARYYRAMLGFIGRPRAFEGFGGAAAGLFASVPERNAAGLFGVYAGAEIQFRELERLLADHEHWVALLAAPGGDLDEFVASRLEAVEDWELNFRALRQRQRDSERLPDSMRVGPFAVSFAPFKGAVDDGVSRLSDALLLSLKRSAAAGARDLGAFLDDAMGTLNSRPSSVGEIGEAKQRWKSLHARKAGTRAALRELQRKATLLRQMAGVAVDLGGAEPRVEAFEEALAGFEGMLEEQKDELRAGITRRGREASVEVDKFASRWQALRPKVDAAIDAASAERTLRELEEWKGECDGLHAAAEELRRDARHFDMPEPGLENLDAVKADIDAAQESWSLYGAFSSELGEMTGEQWISFRARLFAFEDFCGAWQKRLRERTKEGRRDAVTLHLVERVRHYRAVWPLLGKVKGDAFERDHWRALFFRLKLPADVTLQTLTLAHFLGAHELMVAEARAIDDLAARAQGEVTIREAVEELKVWADQAEFKLTEHRGGKGRATPLIRAWKELFSELGDQQSLVQSLKDSPYFPPFADQCEQFEARVGLLDECLHQLNVIQRKWVYLEPIFARGALPQEQGRFQRVDQEFFAIMEGVKANPNVMKLAAGGAALRETVAMLLDQLERCQRALNDFLEEKRSRFPRFYFVGDDDLLEILGQAQNPRVIQDHLKKLFAGISSVAFSEDSRRIEAMRSGAGEEVRLARPVAVTAEVEGWMQSLADGMVETLAAQLRECAAALARGECDLARYPSQVLCVAEQVSFTRRVEHALGAGGAALEKLGAELQARLAELTSVESPDDRVLELKVKALVMDLIHSIDVVELLARERVASADHYLWQKQLRYYLAAGSGRCEVRMCDARFDYTYEYQGNAAKLVHTPLTDKCYLVLTQGMHLGYGGNPYGPAGTGKTESVKALGNALGRQVLVMNCDEGIDFQSMGRIFTGLVQSGAWGCFDEFNRLKEDQLSAVSQQIQVIQGALKQRAPQCRLLDADIAVNPNAAIFVTLNPASKEYGGRSKLPHNLKMLFRSVAMSAPDIRLIAEVILRSEGFRHAREVGRKIVEVYALSRQLLSPQKHYDWGLRAMKTVLRHGGQLIHAEKKAAAAGGGSGGGEVDLAAETRMLVGALRINTLSKLTYEDGQRFQALIQDVFPGLSVEPIDYAELEGAVAEALQAEGLERVDGQVRKVLQLYEALNQRTGVVVVGPSGCGKSVLWRVLLRALERLGRPVRTHVMNPKAMPRQELLGHMDADTREWFDGVLTAAARQVVKDGADTRSWVVCDGDIDPEWIESLNSVLDDNRLLTLPNGERIQFGANVNFLFETHDLQHASPATVSRMGMIFLSEQDVDLRSIVASWLRRQDEAMRGKIGAWVDELFYHALEWVADNGDAVVPTTRAGLVQTTLSHLTSDLVPDKGSFVCGLVRGAGSNLPEGQRAALARQIFEWAGERPPDPERPLNCFYSAAAGGFQCYLGATERDVRLGADEVSAQRPPVVATVDVLRNRALVEPWLVRMEPTLLVGPEGCGKSLLLAHCLGKMRGATVCTVHCSAQTTAAHLVQKLRDACATFTTTKGRVLRPKEGDRVVLVLKDLSLPRPDEYDTIQLIAMLQQLVTYSGFYDSNLDWIGVERVQFVATMCPGAAAAISTRFTSAVNLAALSYPDAEQLRTVYTCYLGASLRLAGAGAEVDAARLCRSTVDVYDRLRAEFSVDDHRHYFFCPRDLTAWAFGLMRYGPGCVLDSWANEARRIFGDRLVGDAARASFERTLAEVLMRDWNHEVKDAGDSLFVSSLDGGGGGGGGGGGDNDTAAQIRREFGAPLERVSRGDYAEMAAAALHTYQRANRDLGLVMMPETLDAVARVDRVLSRPGGSLLLAGSSGVGRRGTATLAAHMSRVDVFSPAMSKDFGDKEFRADLKELVRRAGVDGDEVLLYMEDHHLVDPRFLEYVNSLLSSGEVPGLFTPKELEPLLAPLKERFAGEGVRHHRSLFDFFVARVRAHLHVALSLDPDGPSFAAHCQSNPALLTRCTTQWVGTWSREGLQQVPLARLRGILCGEASGGDVDGDGVAEADADADAAAAPEPTAEGRRILRQVVQIHESAPGGGTPTKYAAFMDAYVRLLGEHRRVRTERKKHLETGLAKLDAAAETVDVLSKQAEVDRVKMEEKEQEANRALTNITERVAAASERRMEAKSVSATLGDEEVKLSSRKTEIQKQLADVQPLLDEARSAVGSIQKGHLSEIKAFRMPPPAIYDVLTAVMMLMRQPDTSWTSIKRFLSSPSMKDEIVNFDAHNITPAIRAEANALLRKKPDSFDAKKIARSSQAAAPLAAWVVANLSYSAVLESVAPLEREFNGANRALDSHRKRIGQLNAELGELDAEVETLKRRVGELMGEAESLRAGLRRTTEMLGAAQTLMEKLGGERGRWQAQVHELDAGLRDLPHHALLAAAFCTYLGGHPEDVRADTMREWRERCGVDASWSFVRFMSTESELLRWKADGLPADGLSTENALVLLNGTQCPFVVDPNGQASQWLAAHLGAGAVTVAQQDPRFTNQLELAVRFGKTLVVTEADGVLPVLYPLLRGDASHQGARRVVQVGAKAVDFNPDFRLFLVTRNAAPDLPGTAAALVNEVNFAVTRSGLEGQLLGLTLNRERPELEREKSRLLADEDRLKIQLADLERSLLGELAASEGNILENKALIESLERTKTQSEQIASALEHSKSVQADLDRQREAYRGIARAGAATYFTVERLRAVNHMYQFALPQFVGLFQRNLESGPQAESGGGGGAGGSGTEDRVRALERGLRLKVYEFVSRSLFKADRLMFGMHLVHCLLGDMFADGEWEAFTGGGVASGARDKQQRQPHQLPAWASPDRRESFERLAAALPSLVERLQLGDGQAWAAWSRSPSCEREFPRLERPPSAFQRLLVTQALRPDRLVSAMESFVGQALGVASLALPAAGLAELAAESSPGTPVLFVTTPGVDPSQELEEHCAGAGRELVQIAMGQGQCDSALAAVRDAAKAGGFVALKNLHLVAYWLPALEKQLKALSAGADPAFRVWLTTEPHDSFPPMLLQQSLKVTYESPPGIRANLARTYAGWSDEFVARGPPVRAQLLFMLAWFHAVVQERRTYVPQGFTKAYEFTLADLRAGADVVDAAAAAAGGNAAAVPWQRLHGLLEDAIYGGRIDSDEDTRVLVCYLRRFFSARVLSGKDRLASFVELPRGTSRAEYARAAAAVPDRDDPYVFGLPANVEGSLQRLRSAAAAAMLRRIDVQASTSVRFDRSRWRASLAPIFAVWQGAAAAPPRRSPSTQLAGGADGVESPCSSFLRLELARADSIAALVGAAVQQLRAVLDGTAVLTADARETARTLLHGEVPLSWYRLWPDAPEEPAAFLRGLLRRRAAVQRLSPDALLSEPLCLADFFSPQTFLQVLRQETARRGGVPIDRLRVVASLERQPAPCVAASRTLLQGCAVDGGALVPLRGEAPAFFAMPTVYLTYAAEEPAGGVPVPVYLSSSRERRVCSVRLPSAADEDALVLAGTALFLE